MRTLLLATTSALALGLASSAFAADLIIIDEPEALPIVSSNDWTGAYIGGHVGYGWGTVDWYFTGDDPEDSEQYDLDGWLAGLQAGYNWQFDSFVLGVEGDVSWSGITGESPDFDPGDVTRDINWTSSLRARAGFAADAFLIYATAGVAWAGSEATVFGDSDDNVHVGWTAGVGAEVMVTEDISLRGEYRFSAYSHEEYDYDGLEITTGFDTHTVTAGLNFHF